MNRPRTAGVRDQSGSRGPGSAWQSGEDKQYGTGNPRSRIQFGRSRNGSGKWVGMAAVNGKPMREQRPWTSSLRTGEARSNDEVTQPLSGRGLRKPEVMGFQRPLTGKVRKDDREEFRRVMIRAEKETKRPYTGVLRNRMKPSEQQQKTDLDQKSRMNTRPFTGKPNREEKQDNVLFRQYNMSHTSVRRESLRPESAPAQRPIHIATNNNNNAADNRLNAYISKLKLGHGPSMPATLEEEKREEMYMKNLYIWGENKLNQFGQDTGGSEYLAEPVCAWSEQDEEQGMEDTIDVACGYTFSVAVVQSGRGYIWGGPYSSLNAKVALQIPNSLSIGIPRIKAVSCGRTHGVALLEGGAVVGWGSNKSKQLGEDIDDSMTKGTNRTVHLRCFSGVHAIGICCGSNHTLVVTSSGHVLGVGDNTHGQLGAKTKAVLCGKPVQMVLDSSSFVKALACGDSHSLVALQNQDVFITGVTSYPSERSEMLPIKVAFFEKNVSKFFKIQQIQSRGMNSLLVSERGELFVWNDINNIMCMKSIYASGIRIQHACFGFKQQLIAVSCTSNVYHWGNYNFDMEPKVMTYFASNGVRMNYCVSGSGHMIVARKKRADPWKFMERPEEEYNAPILVENDLEDEQETEEELDIEEEEEDDKNSFAIGKCLAWGSGLKEIVAGSPLCTFQVELNDENGKRFDDGMVQVNCCLSRDNTGRSRINSLKVSTRRTGKGLFECSYSASSLTKAHVNFYVIILVDDEQFAPFRVEVVPGPCSPKHFEVQYKHAECGELTIQQCDQFRNPLVQNESVSIDVLDAEDAIIMNKSTNQAREIIPIKNHEARFIVVKLTGNESVRRRIVLGPERISLKPTQKWTSSQAILECDVEFEYSANDYNEQCTFCSFDAELEIEFTPTLKDQEKACKVMLRNVWPDQKSAQVRIQMPELACSRIRLETKVTLNKLIRYENLQVLDVDVFPKSVIEFAIHRSLERSSKIIDGEFFFTTKKEDKWAENHDDVLRIDSKTDGRLFELMKYVDQFVRFLPSKRLKAQLIGSLLSEWMHESHHHHQEKEGTSTLDFSVNHADHGTVKMLLFKFLCDLHNISCSIDENAAGVRVCHESFDILKPHVQK